MPPRVAGIDAHGVAGNGGARLVGEVTTKSHLVVLTCKLELCRGVDAEDAQASVGRFQHVACQRLQLAGAHVAQIEPVCRLPLHHRPTSGPA